MRCSFCSAPLPKKGLICEYCGKRNPINLESFSYKEVDFNKNILCPVCNERLKKINIGNKENFMLMHCAKCDGIFIKMEELEKLLETKDNRAKIVDIQMLNFITNHPRFEIEKKIIYKKCPVCKKEMIRKNYRSVSGVIVDICKEHGVWLDGGELKQLIEWKKAGGDLKAKEKKPLENLSFKDYKEEKREFDFGFDPLDALFRWIYGF